MTGRTESEILGAKRITDNVLYAASILADSEAGWKGPISQHDPIPLTRNNAWLI